MIKDTRKIYLDNECQYKTADQCNFIQNSITDLRNIHSFKKKMFRKIFEVSFGHLKMSDYLKKTHPPCYPVYLDRRRNVPGVNVHCILSYAITS